MEDELQLHLGTRGAAGISDGKKVIFNSKLVTGSLMSAFSSRKNSDLW